MVSIILPAYNEEKNIEKTLEEVYSFFAAREESFEIIVVNDGSSDNTHSVAQKFANNKSEIKIINHEKNLGYGAALNSGFKAARGDLVFFMDSDGQFDIKEYAKLVDILNGYDGVLGYRIKRNDHFGRIVAAWGWNLLSRLFFRIPYRDIDCAFKLFRRHVLENISITSTGAGVNLEIIAKSIDKGYRFGQVGVHHKPRLFGCATGLRIGVVITGLKEFYRLYRMRLRKWQ